MSKLENVTIDGLKVTATMLQVRVKDERGFPASVRFFLQKGSKDDKVNKTLDEIQEGLLNAKFPVKAHQDIEGHIKFEVDDEIVSTQQLNVYTAPDMFGGTYTTFVEPYEFIDYNSTFNELPVSMIGQILSTHVEMFIDDEYSMVVQFTSSKGEKFGKRVKLASVVNGTPQPNIVQIDGRSATPWFEAFGIDDKLDFVANKGTAEADLNIQVNGNKDKTKTWLAPSQGVTKF